MTATSNETMREQPLPVTAPPPTRIRLDVMCILDGPAGTAKVIAIQYTGTDQRMTSKTVHDHVPLGDLMGLVSELQSTELLEVLSDIGAF